MKYPGKMWAAITIFLPSFLISIGGKEIKAEISSFHEVTQSKAFIDKSMFIKVLMGQSKCLYVSAPSKFGKSLLIDMLSTFFQMPYDGAGNSLPANSSRSLDTFKTLAIFKEQDFIYDHFGRYPVIHFNFREVVGENPNAFLSNFSECMGRLYKRFSFLLNSTHINEADKNMIRSYFIETGGTQEPYTLVFSLVNLCKYLFQHFKEKCFILIDDFDAPIETVVNLSVHSDTELMLNILRKFMAQSFKTNKHLGRGYFTGRFNAGYLFQQATKVQNKHFTNDEKIAPYFGLTKEEVKVLGERFGKSEKDLEKIKKWYGGYYVLGTKMRMYNTLSVIKSMESGDVRAYWKEPETLKDYHNMLFFENVGRKIQETIESSVNINLADKVYAPKIKLLQKTRDINICRESSSKDAKHVFLQYLFERGFFTKIGQVAQRGRIKVPNIEVKNAILEALHDSWAHKYGMKSEDEKTFVEAIKGMGEKTDNYIKFLKTIKGLFQHSKTFPANELELCSMFYYILNKFSDFFVRFQIERETKTKIDLLLVRRDPSDEDAGSILNTGIIIQVKMGHGQTAHQALQQTLEPNNTYKMFYEEELRAYQPMENTILIGLVCAEKIKQCEMAYLYNSVLINDVVKVHT